MSIRHRSVGIARDQQLAAIVNRPVTARTAFPPTSYFLGQNAARLWVAKAYDGKIGGLFRSQKDAQFTSLRAKSRRGDLQNCIPIGLRIAKKRRWWQRLSSWTPRNDTH